MLIVEGELRTKCARWRRHRDRREDAKERLRAISRKVLVGPSGCEDTENRENAEERAHDLTRFIPDDPSNPIKCEILSGEMRGGDGRETSRRDYRALYEQAR